MESRNPADLARGLYATLAPAIASSSTHCCPKDFCARLPGQNPLCRNYF